MILPDEDYWYNHASDKEGLLYIIIVDGRCKPIGFRFREGLCTELILVTNSLFLYLSDGTALVAKAIANRRLCTSMY